jgi:hypothetical protein
MLACKNLVRSIEEVFDIKCGYKFASYDFKHADLTVVIPKVEGSDFGFWQSITNIKRKHATAIETEGAYLTDNKKEFLATCKLNLSFTTARTYDRTKWLSNTLRQFA